MRVDNIKKWLVEESTPQEIHEISVIAKGLCDCLEEITTISPVVQEGRLRKVVRRKPLYEPTVKQVIFNEPATIVYWKDGTKTVVRCQKGDAFNKETGIALCYLKKMMGNDGSYYERIKTAIGANGKERC